MILSFHPCIDADIQIILGDRPLDPDISEAIRRADAIILPQACTQALYEACARSKASLFPDYRVRIAYPGKIGQSRLFRDLGLRQPKTSAWESVSQFRSAHPDLAVTPHTLPFLIKEDRRHEGEGIFFVTGRKDLNEALDHLALRERSGKTGFVTQEYIPCEGNVLRTVVIGRRIVTYWKRPAKAGQMITTISRGAVVDAEWRPELRKKGEFWAMRLSRGTGINLAAIDFVFPLIERDPDPLFLEINYYFGRRGLGGTEAYYRLLYEGARDWIQDLGLDVHSIRLV